jgi:hypothetical protein
MSDSNIAGIDFTDETKSALYGAVLGKLREYSASSRLPSNMKWHKSYPTNWERLDNPKRQKVKQFWGSLPAELRAEILLSAQQEVAAANADVTARNVNTTKHDKARLLHLRADSRLSLIWANAFSTLDRQQLDARNTATFTENEPWAVLANAFNNYAEYAYTNACLQYEGIVHCCS